MHFSEQQSLYLAANEGDINCANTSTVEEEKA